MKKDFLINELLRWVEEHGGRVPKRDEMKKKEGYPSSSQYRNHFENWNEVLIEAGLTPNNLFWKEEEDSLIIKHCNSLSDKELAKKLGRTKNAVSYRRKELGLLRQSKKRKWKKWEKEYLRNNFYYEDEEEICRILHPRKWETIRAYATKNLNLNRKNKLYKYQVSPGYRECKRCHKILKENRSNFFITRNSFRTMCITCYKEFQEVQSRKKGVLTRKLVSEMLGEGLKYCGKCETWKTIAEFRMNHESIAHIHRWCEKCEKIYMKEYHLRNMYGPNYRESYLMENKHLIDRNGEKWDSVIEKNIADWLIENNFSFGKGPYYKEVFPHLPSTSKLKFDWVVTINKKNYYVEYFGLWDTNIKVGWVAKYTKKAKKKIRLMYKNQNFSQFIIIFPNYLKTKKLEDIFRK